MAYRTRNPIPIIAKKRKTSKFKGRDLKLVIKTNNQQVSYCISKSKGRVVLQESPQVKTESLLPK